MEYDKEFLKKIKKEAKTKIKSGENHIKSNVSTSKDSDKKLNILKTLERTTINNGGLTTISKPIIESAKEKKEMMKYLEDNNISPTSFRGKMILDYGVEFGLDMGNYWTQDIALTLASELITYLKEPGQTFINGYLKEKNIGAWTINNLKNKYPVFDNIFTLAKQIEEQNIIDMASSKKCEASFAKFLLINKHNWKEKTEQDINVSDNTIKFKFGNLDITDVTIIPEKPEKKDFFDEVRKERLEKKLNKNGE